MRVLHGASSDGGGAGTAAYRILQAVQRSGVEARMRVQVKCSSDPSVLGPKTRWEHLRARKVPLTERGWAARFGSRDMFSPGLFPSIARFIPRGFDPDIIHLHWIADAFLHPRDLARWKVPIVWTLHDMWAFTGGCHYDGGCGRFVDRCGACPQLSSRRERDLSRLLWWRKSFFYKRCQLTITAPSRWLANEARRSSLFATERIETIPYGLDETLYEPTEKGEARRLLGLPPDKHLILAGAANFDVIQRKGSDLLIAALPRVTAALDNIELVVFGGAGPRNHASFDGILRCMGSIDDEKKLALLYSSADVFVAPSREENLAQTMIEAMLCGTPTVAFGVGGMPDLIEHKQTGYLARPLDVNDLAEGIVWVLRENQNGALGERARAKAERDYARDVMGRRFEELYKDLLR